MRAGCIAQDVTVLRPLNPVGWVHPRRGSNPARIAAVEMAHPRRAEIFAPPHLAAIRSLRRVAASLTPTFLFPPVVPYSEDVRGQPSFASANHSIWLRRLPGWAIDH